MRVMLDTNAYSAYKRGDGATKETLSLAEEVLVPTPVLGELRSGFRQGNREGANLAELEEFLSRPRVRVHPLGEGTAIYYAEIYGALRAAGKPIPTNDLWIAAAALETGSILLSRDSHFDAVAGLIRNGPGAPT
jgi:predicted nucleic acid-binding protein